MAKTPTQIGQTSPGTVDTDNASKQGFIETVVSGTAFQISAAQNSNLYLDITTSSLLAIAIGPTAATQYTVMASKAAPIGLLNIRVPANWFIKLTGTPANFTAFAVLD